MHSKVSIPALFYSLYAFNLFRPYPDHFDGVLRFFWADVMVICGVALVWLSSLLNQRIRTSGRLVLLVFCFNFALVPAVIYQAANTNGTYFLRVTYFLFLAAFFYYPWFKMKSRAVEVLCHVILTSIPFMAALFIVQMFDVPGISAIVHEVWGTEKLRGVSSFSPRVYGSFANANWAGVYIMVAWAVLLYSLMRRSVSLAMFCFLCFVLAVMVSATGSRTGLLGSVVVVGWMLGFFLSRYRNYRTWFLCAYLLIVVSAAAVTLIFVLDGTNLVHRFAEFTSAESLTDIRTGGTRVSSWRAGVEHWLTAPLFGPGVSGSPHNSVITWLQAFGIIGFIPLVFLLLKLVAAWVVVGFREEVILSSGITVAFLLMSMAAEFFFTTQVIVMVLPFVLWPILNRRRGSGRREVPAPTVSSGV